MNAVCRLESPRPDQHPPGDIHDDAAKREADAQPPSTCCLRGSPMSTIIFDLLRVIALRIMHNNLESRVGLFALNYCIKLYIDRILGPKLCRCIVFLEEVHCRAGSVSSQVPRCAWGSDGNYHSCVTARTVSCCKVRLINDTV